MHNGLYNPTPLDIALTGEGRAEIVKTFNYTGSAQQWTVLAGISGIIVECFDAEGTRCSWTGWKDGGKGGMANAKVPVTPGETVHVYVGGKGGVNGTGVGGWNGGGIGGGSSYYDAVGNTDKSTTKGVRSGNGEIIIKY